MPSRKNALKMPTFLLKKILKFSKIHSEFMKKCLGGNDFHSWIPAKHVKVGVRNHVGL